MIDTKPDHTPPDNAAIYCEGMAAIEILLRAAVAPGYSITNMESNVFTGPLIPYQPCKLDFTYPTPTNTPTIPDPSPPPRPTFPPAHKIGFF